MFRQAASSLARHVTRSASVNVRPATQVVVRSFADEAFDFEASKKLFPTMSEVKLPLRQPGVSGRYSEALYQAATEGKAVDRVHDELKQVLQMVKESEELHGFFEDPTVSASKKEAYVLSLMKDMKVSSLTEGLMGTLAQNGRLKELTNIGNAFDAQVNAALGNVDCVLTTAEAITDAEKAAAAAMCKAEAQKVHGKKANVSLKYEIDEVIEGGWTLDIGDLHYDYSIDTRRRAVEAELKSIMNSVA